MNQIVRADRPRANIAAGGPVAAIVPQSLDDAFRLSQALAVSGMAPRGMDKPEQIMVAIMAGAELGLAPFQSLQSFAVVNGRPTLWGDGLIAVVRARGVRVKEWIEGEADAMVAHCIATRPDTGEEIARAFTVADAKKASLWGKQGPWQQYPKRMLQMRARALALRDGCADMLRGIQVREEVEDYGATARDLAPQPAGIMARLPGNQNGEGFSATNMDQLEHPLAPEEVDAILDGDDIPNFSSGGGSNPADAEGQPREAGESPAPVDPPAAGSQSDDDGFPGDRQPSSSTKAPPGESQPQGSANNGGGEGGLTLNQRVQAFKDRCSEARTVLKLRALGSNQAAVQLRRDLDNADPEGLSDLGDWFAEREVAMERIEREAAK